MKKKVLAVALVLVLLLLAIVGIGTTPLVTAQLLTPELSVYNPSPIVEVGQTFTVRITIRNVVPAHNLSQWIAGLGYDTTKLDCLSTSEGPFFPSFAGSFGTSYTGAIVDTSGYVALGSMFVGNHTEPFSLGDEILAYVEFRCTGAGVSVLDLYDTELQGSSLSDLIPHDVFDGSVTQIAPPQPGVGGLAAPINIAPIDNPASLAPYIGLVSLIVCAVAVSAVVAKRKRK